MDGSASARRRSEARQRRASRRDPDSRLIATPSSARTGPGSAPRSRSRHGMPPRTPLHTSGSLAATPARSLGFNPTTPHSASGRSAGGSYEAHCVTVVGFPHGQAGAVRQWFTDRGAQVMRYAEVGDHALHICFDQLEDAAGALSKSGTTGILRGVPLGIIPCRDPSFLAGQGGHSLATPSAKANTSLLSTSTFRTRGGKGDTPARRQPGDEASAALTCAGLLCPCCQRGSTVSTPSQYAPQRRGGWVGWAARLLDVLCSM